MYPQDFQMRHYIFLSEEHARSKYLGRPFSPEEVAKGWHGDKLRATKNNLEFPDDSKMFTLPHWTSRAFDTSRPSKTHYWDWDSLDLQEGSE
jgi:hypothetical protein